MAIMLDLIFQRGKPGDDLLAFGDLLRFGGIGDCFMDVVNGPGLLFRQPMQFSFHTSAVARSSTNITGHRSLAEMNPNEFLSLVCDGASLCQWETNLCENVVRHTGLRIELHLVQDCGVNAAEQKENPQVKQEIPK